MECLDPGFLQPDTDRSFRRIGRVGSFASLFPKPISPSERSRAGIAVAYVTGFAALTIITLLRQSGRPAWNTVWAEDGRVFYQQALEHSVSHDLTSLYGGYFELLPRLLGEFAALFPVKDLAPVMALSGAAILSAVALIVFHASRGHIDSPNRRLILCLAIVLLPIATGELLNNVVNLPWWLFFATFWVLLWRPTSLMGSAVAALVCFLAVASEPVVGLLLPIVFLRVYTLRRISEQAATGGFIAGLIYQAAVTYLRHGGVESTSTFGGVAQDFLLRVGLGWLAGAHLTTYFISRSSVMGMVIGGLLFSTLAFVAAWRSDVRIRLFTAVAMTCSLIFFVAPVWLRGIAPALAHESARTSGRFSETPILILVSVLLVRFESLPPPRSMAAALAVPISLVLVGTLWLSDFRTENYRSFGPAWSVQVRLATKSCKGPIRSYLESHGLPLDEGVVAIKTAPPTWSVTVPCRSLMGSSPL